MTTDAGELRDLPSPTPGPAELADLELLMNGAFHPLRGFLGAVDAATVAAAGRLADGTPWPAPVTLAVPEDLTKEDRILLADPEGVPLAVLQVTDAWQDSSAAHRFPAGDPLRTAGRWRAAGPVRGRGARRRASRSWLGGCAHSSAPSGAGGGPRRRPSARRR